MQEIKNGIDRTHLNNVIVTSHQAFFTQEAMANIANTTLQNIRDFRTGSELQNEVKTEF